MPRMMSFALTTAQFEARTKTVTRRKGWATLCPGDVVMGIEKGMGLRKGQKVRRLHPIRIASVRREPLNAITWADVVREGFPEWSVQQFIDLYRRANGGPADQPVTRIEFEHLEVTP